MVCYAVPLVAHLMRGGHVADVALEDLQRVERDARLAESYGLRYGAVDTNVNYAKPHMK